MIDSKTLPHFEDDEKKNQPPNIDEKTLNLVRTKEENRLF